MKVRLKQRLSCVYAEVLEHLRLMMEVEIKTHVLSTSAEISYFLGIFTSPLSLKICSCKNINLKFNNVLREI